MGNTDMVEEYKRAQGTIYNWEVLMLAQWMTKSDPDAAFPEVGLHFVLKYYPTIVLT